MRSLVAVVFTLLVVVLMARRDKNRLNYFNPPTYYKHYYKFNMAAACGVCNTAQGKYKCPNCVLK